MKNKKTSKVPKTLMPIFKRGGMFQNGEAGNLLNNIGVSAARNTLAAVGAENAIPESSFKGGSAKDFQRYSSISTKVTKAAAPIAMNMIAPGSGQFVSMGQGAIGNAIGEDKSSLNPDGTPKHPGADQFGNALGQGIGIAGSFMGGAPTSGVPQMGEIPSAKYGGMMKFGMGGAVQYANGGVGQINAEVEGGGYNQDGENAIAPNGQFTQFNGPTHAQGGIQTDMAPGTKIFSDKLKAPGTNKTFAKLNINNNTNREDKLEAKGNLDPKSEMSINLTRMAKMKNSDMLFAMQEQLKKDKVVAYAKRMGVQLPSMDNEQAEPQGMSEQSEGEMPMAKYGGIHIKPSHKGRFTAYKERTGKTTEEALHSSDPHVRQMANFAKNAAGWKHEMGGVHQYSFGGPVNSSNPNDMLNWAKSEQANLQNRLNIGTPKEARKFVGEYELPARNELDSMHVSPYNPNIGMGFKGSKAMLVPVNKKGVDDVYDLNKGRILSTPPKNGERSVYVDYQNAYPKHSMGGVQLPYYNTNNDGTPKYATGGVIPKYDDGGKYGIETLIGPEDPNAPTRMIPSQIYNPSIKETPDDALSVFRKQNANPLKKEKTPIDWKSTVSDTGNFLAQNAGNLYNLSRYNKPEVETYNKMKATYLDPSAALSFNDQANARYNEAIAKTSGGNAAAAASNLRAGYTDKVMNRNKILSEYANANAGIANQFGDKGQYNTELAYRETIANAENRARNRSGKAEAIGNIGENFGIATKAGKEGQMDQKTLDLMMKYYNTPEFQKMMKGNKFKK